MNVIKRIQLVLSSCFISLLVFLFLLLQFPPIITAASIAQGYHSSQPITAGAIVSLTQTGSSEVKTTDLDNEALMFGVAVDSSNAIVDLQPTGSDVRVAISGEVPLLVSTESGDIKAGDSLIISQIAGVAMKDSKNSQAKRYIGVASEGLTAATSNTKIVQIKLSGSDKNVSVGLIKAKILLSDRRSADKPNPIMSFLQRVVGKPVGTAQVIAAVAVFLTTFVFTALLLNGSIRGAFVSIGRNPLSKHTIVSNMIRVTTICLIILIAGVSLAYAILLV